MNRLDRLALASRAFIFAAILGLAAATGDVAILQFAILMGAISATAAFTGLAAALPPSSIAIAEASLVGLLVGTALPDGAVLLPYLVVPVLIAGAANGMRAIAWVTATEVVCVFAMMLAGPSVNMSQIQMVGPWFVTAVGAGLVGTMIRQIGPSAGAREGDESYESARRLVTQLRTVARRLSAGLDPVGMSAQLLAFVHERLGDDRSALFVRTEGGVLTPLGYRGVGAQRALDPDDPLVHACWEEMEIIQVMVPSGSRQTRHRIALPLRVGSRMVGIVLVDAAGPVDQQARPQLMAELDEHALRIDTALAFDEVRSIATAEERRRLAREIHDGVAQEIASLGYVVDDLASSVTSTTQRDQLQQLRRELTRVVSELRLSIFDLRSEVDPSVGLGTALSDYVRQVGARSNLTVHLTLDEAPTRLRAEVETELLRIAQEAITNARKHSGGKNLWVDCRVHPPSALIQVRDDGGGLRRGRDDSYGLRIMRERAERIGATLCIDGASHIRGKTGTLVSISLGEEQTRRS